ncbi:MAG: glycosyltransferase [Sedimentibacter sp.]
MCNNNKEPIEANNPLIAVYGIYKNEQNFIERFLESVKTADEIVLCDTGATDETNNIIKRFIENNPNSKLKIVPIYVSPWRFDDARNTSLSLVSPEIDICISLDIDELLMENWKEHLINQWEDGVTRYYHKFKTYWADGGISEHWHERIHIRNGYTWKLPVGRNTEAYFTVLEAAKRISRIIDYHYNSSAWDVTFDDFKANIFEQAKKEGLML